MRYEIIFDEDAIDFLEKLTKQEKERIFNRILCAKENPFHFFERLKGVPCFKLRVGDYRVIADIKENEKIIYILCIGHRKNVYKRI